MTLSDQEKKDLSAALLLATPEQLDQIKTGLEQTRDNLMDLNSLFPATREFLETRGLTHVRQLDRQGQTDLLAHLDSVRNALYENKA